MDLVQIGPGACLAPDVIVASLPWASATNDDPPHPESTLCASHRMMAALARSSLHISSALAPRMIAQSIFME